MKLILLGPQGSGKGTLAKRISKDFAIPQISTGDLFRDNIAKRTKLGQIAETCINKGQLCPLDLTLKILKDRISKPDCQKGFILDGFPRTLEQAQALKDITDIDFVINVDLPFDECIRRLEARRTCPKCGDIDSTFYDGYTGLCRKCGATLMQRDDDKPAAIKTRLEVYEKQTQPLINFYSDRLFKVSSIKSPEETYKPVKTCLKKQER